MTESNPLCEGRTGGANVTNLHSDYNSPETEVAQHGHRLGRNDRSGAGFTNRDELIYSLFGAGIAKDPGGELHAPPCHTFVHRRTSAVPITSPLAGWRWPSRASAVTRASPPAN